MKFTPSPVLVPLVLSLLSIVLFVGTRYGIPPHKVSDDSPIGDLRTYTYRGTDFPQSWPLPPLETVQLSHEDSVHYDLETDLGIAEWNQTLPSGGALLYLGPDRRPFTLSMFHQLRCLDIIRRILVAFYLETSPEATFGEQALAHHCMNYLRQTVLCRADLRLEDIRAPSGPKITVSDVMHTCKDWTAVYAAAERNFRDSTGGTA